MDEIISPLDGVTATQWGVVSLAVGYIYLLARFWLTDKRKANESHVNSVEKNQDRLYTELADLRKDLRLLQAKLDKMQSEHLECETSLSAAQTRLSMLEKFRNIAAADDPTGKTLKAMPPPQTQKQIDSAEKTNL